MRKILLYRMERLTEMLEDLLSGGCVVGTKQVHKALAAGTLRRVYIAEDVEAHIRAKLVADCESAGVETVDVASMKQLGKACSIEVGAACAGLVKPRCRESESDAPAIE